LIAWAATAQTALGTEPFIAESPRAAADYLKGRNDHAMLAYYHNQLVFEEYFNGWSVDQPHRLKIASV
jgi:hypothetical protein